MTLLNSFNGNSYFFSISLPQHCSGTLQAPSSPALQVQAFSTRSSRPQALHAKRSPSFISAQSAMSSPPHQCLVCEKIHMSNTSKKKSSGQEKMYRQVGSAELAK
jgi:hypothetical protein